MPLCGFNDKMIKGLQEFQEGLVEHGLVYRGRKNKETLEKGIKREIADMARLQPELYRIENTPKRTITKGIVTFATGFYLLMRQKEIEKKPQQYKKMIQEVNNYFKKMDEKFYGELEGKPTDMQELATYLNKINI